MPSLFGRAIGSVVAPVVELIDIDGVVQRINLEEALSRVDLDALLSRIDLDALLERVDVNHHLERVDFDAVIDRVDLDRIVARSNIGAIVARSSAGAFDVVLDGARSQIVRADVAFQRLGRCACCRRDRSWELPPLVAAASGGASNGATNFTGASNGDGFPERSLQLALYAQRRYAGILARSISAIIDSLIITIVFTVFLLLVETFVNRFVGSNSNSQMTFDEEWVLYPIAYWLWSISYTATLLAATGRTVGNAICGLLVVKSNAGDRIAPLQALIRTILEPFSLITVAGTLMGWVRKDGRQLHDILTRTGVCYSWDATLACLRQQAMDDKQDV